MLLCKLEINVYNVMIFTLVMFDLCVHKKFVVQIEIKITSVLRVSSLRSPILTGFGSENLSNISV